MLHRNSNGSSYTRRRDLSVLLPDQQWIAPGCSSCCLKRDKYKRGCRQVLQCGFVFVWRTLRETHRYKQRVSIENAPSCLCYLNSFIVLCCHTHTTSMRDVCCWMVLLSKYYNHLLKASPNASPSISDSPTQRLAKEHCPMIPPPPPPPSTRSRYNFRSPPTSHPLKKYKFADPLITQKSQSQKHSELVTFSARSQRPQSYCLRFPSPVEPQIYYQTNHPQF
jgi:hypothetical protein